MGKKATQVEKHRRVMQVYKMVCLGMDRGEIVEYSGKKWDIKRTQTDEYIKEAREWLKKKVPYERKQELNKAIHRLVTVFRKALEDKKYSACIMAQKELNELIGIKEYKPVDIKTNILTQINQNKNIYENMTEKEIKEEWSRRKKLREKLENRQKNS